MTLASASFSRQRSLIASLHAKGCQTVRPGNFAISASLIVLRMLRNLGFVNDDLNHSDFARHRDWLRLFPELAHLITHSLSSGEIAPRHELTEMPLLEAW